MHAYTRTVHVDNKPFTVRKEAFALWGDAVFCPLLDGTEVILTEAQWKQMKKAFTDECNVMKQYTYRKKQWEP